VILVTVGLQLPFPRLVAAIDRLAPALGERVVAQTGDDDGGYPNLETHARLSAAAFEAEVAAARVIVGHAGIGTVLIAKTRRRPAILFPRRAALGEHRTDHQVATARQLAATPGLYVAWEEADLDRLLHRSDLVPASDSPGPGHDSLVARLRSFIADPPPARGG
jgi:UDP-N-acetylglucosamine transferase subunit ALG13